VGTFRTSTCPPHLRQRSCSREFSSCDVNVLFGLHVFRTPIYFSSRDVNAALCICRHRRQSLLQLPWWCSPKIQALVPHNDRMLSRPASFDETVDLSLAINEWVLCIPSLWWHFRCNSLRQPQNVCVNFFDFSVLTTITRSSAIAEGPRYASCQLKSCQLPRNSAETTYTTSPGQIDGMKLEI